MLREVLERWRQGRRTIAFPAGEPPVLPDRYRGRPALDAAKCPDGCRDCLDACPTDALVPGPSGVRFDLGRCLFCTDCLDACPAGAVSFTRDFRLAARTKEDLLTDGRAAKAAAALDERCRRLLGRALRLRQVSAGGCNACEADLNVLTTVVFDLSRFGVEFVASPRHADGLLVTGAMTASMAPALRAAYDATPEPKIVIAVGACAISGGPYRGHPAVLDGAQALVPVDLFVPGCPPHPLTVLDGLLSLLGRG